MPFGTTNQGQPQYGQPNTGTNQFGSPQYGTPYGISSAMQDWYNSYASPQQMGQDFAGGAGNYGQTGTYNPVTGQTTYESHQNRMGNLGNQNFISGIDPITGDRYTNVEGLMGMFEGAGGGGGYQQYTPTEFQPGQVTPGEGYQQFDYSTIGSGIDPAAVIAAQEYKLQEAMEGDMARAGGRAGQSGFAMSTPYMGELGEAARKASQDRNAMTMQYQYDAAQAQAARDLAQQQQAAQLDFGGWQTGYQGDMQAQMFNAGQGMDHWSQINAMGFADNQGLNQYNQQNQMQGQNFLAGLLGGLL